MTQVYKCDYCTTTNKDGIVLAQHEGQCSFNPTTKKCDTCKHQDCWIHDFSTHCLKHDYEHMEEVGEKGLCKEWELES